MASGGPNMLKQSQWIHGLLDGEGILGRSQVEQGQQMALTFSEPRSVRSRSGLRNRSMKINHHQLTTYITIDGIYANIWGILMVNVTIYIIHGSYGIGYD